MYAVYWRDIESDAAWGWGEPQPPVCVTLGFIIQRPSKTSPWYRIASSFVEGLPGDATIIPKGVVLSVEKIGMAEIVWRP